MINFYKKLLERDKIDRAEFDRVVPDAFRAKRAIYFKAFDVYKTNVLYGLETETETEREEIINWYNTLRDIPDIGITPTTEFPLIPEKIAKYI